MSETSFSQSIQPLACRSLPLTPQQYEQLLQADDAVSRSALLQGTVYAMDAEAIKDLNAIEQLLMKHLYSVYNWALEISPSKELVEIFTLRYTYHNLKVFLKGRATGQSLEHLLMPVGTYSLEFWSTWLWPFG